MKALALSEVRRWKKEYQDALPRTTSQCIEYAIGVLLMLMYLGGP